MVAIAVSSVAGTFSGFITGLVPGLHVNNLAAMVAAYSGATLGLFSALGSSVDFDSPAILVCCYLSSALVSHSFSEAVPNTYVGIPSEDTVSVLPAHRLARAGIGWVAIRAAADGSLAGVVIGVVVLIPVCLVMGPPVDAYSSLRLVMGAIVVALSACLILSDSPSRSSRNRRRGGRVFHIAKVIAVFVLAGLIGAIVFRTNYFACDVPFSSSMVSRSALLLPLFAGLFGLPTLLLSLSSREPGNEVGRVGLKLMPTRSGRGSLLMLAGAVLVGWIPAMTSGSSATLCATASRRSFDDEGDVDSSRRFIWLYAAISSAGAVMSVGALFVISRARSGIMEAVSFFLDGSVSPAHDLCGLFLPTTILLSMVISAVMSHTLLLSLRNPLTRASRMLCSRRVAISAMIFVCSLSALLTGLRGMLLMATACSLGLLTPRIGVRRIQLMGCLLVPVAATFLMD